MKLLELFCSFALNGLLRLLQSLAMTVRGNGIVLMSSLRDSAVASIVAIHKLPFYKVVGFYRIAGIFYIFTDSMDFVFVIL